MFHHSAGCVCRHFPTLYSHIEGLSQLAGRADRPDGFRRLFRPSNIAQGCALTHMGGRCSPRISHLSAGRHGVSHADVTLLEIQVPGSLLHGVKSAAPIITWDYHALRLIP